MADTDLFGTELPAEEKYELSEGSTISEAQLREAEEETQVDAMNRWFRKNFINPEEENPYDSDEGCFVFMNGGPYDPEQEINAHFESFIPEKARNEVISDLEDTALEWDGLPGAGDYDDPYSIKGNVLIQLICSRTGLEFSMIYSH
jgi:hypothetical protein